MDAELVFQASILERQANELEQNLQLVEAQVNQLEEFKKSLAFLEKSKDNEILSPIGRGVFIKSEIKDKEKLFVEVGSNIIVKKTPEETKKIIESQVSRLKQARVQIAAQLEITQEQLQGLLSELQPELQE